MLTSDAHLEKALEEYNEKVDRLEREDNVRELLDAYINRGCILSMMGSNVSAISDFDDAIDIITDLENSGNTVDAGYFVKVYTARGELQTDSAGKDMADDYRVAASKLGQLVPGSRYFDEKATINTCLDCAGDLIDNEYPDDAMPFVEKVLSIVSERTDDVSRNYLLETLNLLGQAHMANEEDQEAYEAFSKAVVLGQGLYDAGVISDEMDLVLAYVSKGDMDERLEKKDEYFADREAAIEMMEDLRSVGGLDDEELLSSLHGEIAQAYMARGEIQKAERHLLKQVSYSLAGSTEDLGENNYAEE
ncbi:MAG: hypothetical protein MJZ38_01670 [archaeon]|nr:hypothetical protein [archaeon]